MQLTDYEQRLRRIGWRGDAALPAGARLARVIAQHRNGYQVHDGDTEFRAQPAPRFLKRGADTSERPAVGDFVALSAAPPAVIETVLPRRTLLSRAAAGERHVRQIIAANIDTVFVVMGLDGDFNARRVERYLALIQGSGARAVIVLTKRDKVDAEVLAARHAELVAAVLAAEIHTVNSKEVASIAPLLAHLRLG